MKYSELTQLEKNKLAKQYEMLVNKITKQFSQKIAYDWNEIKSMAYEGLALAIEKYDDERSEMSFTQYAAYAIRNNILTGLDNESRTVKMTNYTQKQAIADGSPLFTSVSIDRNIRHDEEKKPLEVKLGMISNETFSDGDVFEYLYYRLDEHFVSKNKENVIKCFYMTFGLHGEEETLGKDIAKELKLSEAAVSNYTKKVVNWIKSDRDLCEVLSNLLEK